MLYLSIGAILAIAVKSQTDTACGLASTDCTALAGSGTGVCGTVTTGSVSVDTCVPCNADADCDTTYWNSVYSGTAPSLECSDPLSIGVNSCYPPYCGNGGSCSSGSCVSDFCVDTGGVTTGCSSSDDCDAGSACITVSGVSACIAGACNDDSECGSDESCFTSDTLGYGACVTGISTCSSDSDCSSPTPTCATDYGICYLGCSSDSDCSSLGTGYTCEEDTASDLKGCSQPECTSDSDCGGSWVCNSAYECVECVDPDTDCSTGEVCTGNVCFASSCSTDADCGSSYFCLDGGCVICTETDDCSSYGAAYECIANICTVPSTKDDDGIGQITTYIAMIIMAAVAVNM